MATGQRREAADELEVVLSDEEHRLLQKLDFPCTKEVLAEAERTDEGMVLRMSRGALKEMVGWVAGEANHERRARRAELLNAIADAMESALS